MPDFTHSFAVIVGIDAYENGIPTLKTAANDARELGALLSERHGYESRVLVDKDATLARLNTLLTQELPAEVGPDDRLLFYFAGHGVALDGDDGPQGFILPQDARRDSADSFLAMPVLHDALCCLKCRHFLAILDCCFAGAFRWSSLRDVMALPSVIHQERYDRFIRDPAWQVISSAAYDERALDVLAGKAIGVRDSGEEQHSPFAQLLLNGLNGAADVVPAGGGDGVITATELYVYLDEALAQLIDGQGRRQTPRLWPLRRDDKGQYIFLAPGHQLNLPPAPELTDANNPYRGLQSFDEEHKTLFFGRDRVVRALGVHAKQYPLTMVLGATGTGKSSLVKAGLVPTLRAEGWEILPIVRPGISPLKSLSVAVAALGSAQGEEKPALLQGSLGALTELVDTWSAAHPDRPLLLVIDQLEELVTMCRDEAERELFFQLLANAVQSPAQRLRVVMTLRSDYEPQFAEGPLAAMPSMARFVVPPMTQDELREVIERPASERVLYFQPPELVDRLINEVVQTPGALALLSFTLREMYVRYVERQGSDRALTQDDYQALGGVVGALRHRATEEYTKLDSAHQTTMRRVMLRMVSVEGGDLARRRVPRSELRYQDAAENERVQRVIERLSITRLVVEGLDTEEEPYVEPAHDELVRGWDKLWEWIRAEHRRQDDLAFQRRLTPAAEEWNAARDKQVRHGLLWQDAARCTVLRQVLKSSESWLNGIETQFADQSSRRLRRNRRIRATLTTVLGVLTFLAFLLAWAAMKTREIALSRQLAAQALSEMPNRLDRALLLAVAANQIRKTNEARSSLFATVQYSPRLAAILRAHGPLVSGVAISPGGELAASGSSDTVTFWNLRTHHAVGWLSLPGPVWSMAFSPDGKKLAVGSGNQTVTFWDVASRHLLGPQYSLSDSVRDRSYSYRARVVFRPDGGTLASARGDSTVVLWNALTYEALPIQLDSPGPVTCLAFNPDGTLLAAGNPRGTVLWRLGSPLPTRDILVGGQGGVVSVAFRPDGRVLATSGVNDTTILWNVPKRWRLTEPVLPQPSGVSALAFSARGDTLYAGGDAGVFGWEVREARLIAPLRGHSAGVSDLALSRDGQRMVSGDWDGAVLSWDLTQFPSLGGRMLPTRKSFGGIAYSPDGRRLATRNGDSTLSIWNAERDSLEDVFATGSGAAGGLAFSRDGQSVVYTRGNSVTAVGLRQANDPRSPDLQKAALPGTHGEPHPAHADAGPVKILDFDADNPAGGVAFSPDGKWLAAGLDSVFLWRVMARDSFERVAPIGGHATDVAYSSKGDLIAVGSGDTLLFLHVGRNATSARLPLPRRQPTMSGGPDQFGLRLAFSPDGALLAVGRGDSTLTFWDRKTQRPTDRPVRLPGSIVSLAFDPEGSLLAAGLSDSGVALVDPILRAPLGAPLRARYGDGHALAFSPDGKTLAAGGWGASLILWNMELGKWLERACEVANGNLTPDELEVILPKTLSDLTIRKRVRGCASKGAKE
jgi:WD40 repeat protein